MDMKSTLLDFIRAEREGNLELHLNLQSFAAMLPWLTVYEFVCLLCGIQKWVVKGINDARHRKQNVSKRCCHRSMRN